MKALYDNVSIATSKLTTKTYSTSFSLGIKFLNKEIQNPIYSIYGFVRVADEIVDTFHGFDKSKLLKDFRIETFKAIEQGISTNPILQSFQTIVNQYNIPHELIHTFLDSMEMDLQQIEYDQKMYEKYILGSAEVVGLMCLCVFVEGDMKLYEKLKPFAMGLGSAFQKINFLRDINDDFNSLGRSYFPNVDLSEFNEQVKLDIIKDIEKDFQKGYEGILQLPKKARLGVYVAYIYYYRLLLKIKRTNAEELFNSRIRIPNNQKYALFLKSLVKHSFNML